MLLQSSLRDQLLPGLGQPREAHFEGSFNQQFNGQYTLVQTTRLKEVASRKAANGRKLLWDGFWTCPSNIFVLN